ncbi:MAG: ribosomal protein S18-alanine N-acetyltransferase [Dehalococcoidales bacterium]|nr:ribosomal protein S18-alanine N-acetyltransferase [Dehalococcoidales bacterium]
MLSYFVRPMYKEDASQVAEIDREAFPNEWPPPNFQHELKNRLAHYIIACDGEKFEQPAAGSSDRKLTGLTYRLRRIFGLNHFPPDEPSPSIRHYIIGFIGLWVISDEAHITIIGVRQTYRRQGIGGMLLGSAINLARKLKVRIVTLEVRASNTTAQNLYTRYGFTRVGLRKGYYTNDREDAILMSTEDISSPSFKSKVSVSSFPSN